MAQPPLYKALASGARPAGGRVFPELYYRDRPKEGAAYMELWVLYIKRA